MKRRLLYAIVLHALIYASRLTLEEAIVNSPFKTASLGWTIVFPNEDAVLIKGKKDNWKQWYKVSFASMDTTLFLDSTSLKWKDNDLDVQSLSFSLDSRKILIKTNMKKLWRYSNSADYFVYDLLRKKLYPLTDDNKNLRNVKFSPDGEKIAYVRTDNNLYVFNLSNKRERKLTNSGSETVLNGHFGWLYEEELTGYDGYRWSPNSESIAYWEEDESKVPQYSMINELELYPSIKKIRYPKAGETNPTLRIGIIRVKGTGRKWIDVAHSANGYLPWMEWVNNKKIAFLKMDRYQKNWDLFVSDKMSGKSIKILSESDPEGWLDNDGQIMFLDDGKIIWISERSGFKHLWLSKHSGSKFWQITEGKWEVSKIMHIDEKKQVVYFIANKNSVYENRLYSVRFDGTDLQLLSIESGNHSVTITGGKTYFIDTYSSIEKPKVIVLKDLVTGELIQVLKETDLSQYEEYDWSFPKFVHFLSDDKTVTLDGMLTFPPDYNSSKKYPIIVYGYGMPGTQIVWNRWGSTWNQFLAQQGYIVFSMDSRGMSGRGEAFKNLSYGDMAKYLSKDHETGIKYLIDQGYANPERIGAWGWSGGGYFTCLMLTKNSKYFKAGVAVAPCTDFRLYDTAYTERSMGLPEENKAGYDSTSVISWIHQMKGSILLLHGTADDNVHNQHTTQFVQAALKSGKNVEWYQYPNRNHGIYGGGARDHLYKKMIEFFKEKL